MRTNAKRWLVTLALAAFGVILGQSVAANGFRGRPGGGMAFHPGFGGHGMTVHSVPAGGGMAFHPGFGGHGMTVHSVPAGRGMAEHGHSWAGHTAHNFPAHRSGDRWFRGPSSMRFDGDDFPHHSVWEHGGREYAGWYQMPWYWSPWTFGIGWDPYWWPGYWGAWTGYSYGPDSGEIKLKTDHKMAEVYIDGAYAGLAKDLKTIHLRAGAYELEIRSDDGGIFQDRIYVLAGKTLKITPEFKTASAPAMREGS